MKFNKQLTNKLLFWYNNHKMPMPWRDDKNIYHIWLSEIMLQQTQINTVIPYYTQWLKQFPTINDVASASEDDILKLWEGLGYYSRALNFHKACKTIIESYDGEIPKNDFIKLKGVGRKTANLTLILGHGKLGICVDIHVHRITNRWGYVQTKSPNETERVLRKKLPKRYWMEFNNLLVSFGQNVCKPQSPYCSKCCVAGYCKQAGVKRYR